MQAAIMGAQSSNLAQDSCKPPPVEPVAQAIIKDPKSSLHQTRIINDAPQPQNSKERNVHCNPGTLLLACKPIHMNQKDKLPLHPYH